MVDKEDDALVVELTIVLLLEVEVLVAVHAAVEVRPSVHVGFCVALPDGLTTPSVA